MRAADATELSLYVRLDEDGFRRLVRGESVSLHTTSGQEVRLILADIGWVKIRGAVEDGWKWVTGRRTGL